MKSKMCVIISSMLDYATWTEQSTALGWWLFEEAAKQRSRLEGKGELEKSWGGMGYNGFRIGGMRYGERKDGAQAILMMSGEDAHLLVAENDMPEAHVTRIDAQVTIRLSRKDSSVAERYYRGIEEAVHRGANTKSFRLIRSVSGDSLYVNKRTSPVMLRFYDKTSWFESDETGYYWRYEVEYKREAAQKVYDTFRRQKDMEGFVAGLVFSEYQKRGVSPLFEASTEVNAVSMGVSVSTAETKLEWLEKCVAPVVEQLTLQGLSKEVVGAIGLKEAMAAHRKEKTSRGMPGETK